MINVQINNLKNSKKHKTGRVLSLANIYFIIIATALFSFEFCLGQPVADPRKKAILDLGGEFTYATRADVNANFTAVDLTPKNVDNSFPEVLSYEEWLRRNTDALNPNVTNDADPSDPVAFWNKEKEIARNKLLEADNVLMNGETQLKLIEEARQFVKGELANKIQQNQTICATDTNQVECARTKLEKDKIERLLRKIEDQKKDQEKINSDLSAKIKNFENDIKNYTDKRDKRITVPPASVPSTNNPSRKITPICSDSQVGGNGSGIPDMLTKPENIVPIDPLLGLGPIVRCPTNRYVPVNELKSDGSLEVIKRPSTIDAYCIKTNSICSVLWRAQIETHNDNKRVMVHRGLQCSSCVPKNEDGTLDKSGMCEVDGVKVKTGASPDLMKNYKENFSANDFKNTIADGKCGDVEFAGDEVTCSVSSKDDEEFTNFYNDCANLGRKEVVSELTKLNGAPDKPNKAQVQKNVAKILSDAMDKLDQDVKRGANSAFVQKYIGQNVTNTLIIDQLKNECKSILSDVYKVYRSPYPSKKTKFLGTSFTLPLQGLFHPGESKSEEYAFAEFNKQENRFGGDCFGMHSVPDDPNKTCTPEQLDPKIGFFDSQTGESQKFGAGIRFVSNSGRKEIFKKMVKDAAGKDQCESFKNMKDARSKICQMDKIRSYGAWSLARNKCIIAAGNQFVTNYPRRPDSYKKGDKKTEVENQNKGEYWWDQNNMNVDTYSGVGKIQRECETATGSAYEVPKKDYFIPLTDPSRQYNFNEALYLRRYYDDARKMCVKYDAVRGDQLADAYRNPENYQDTDPGNSSSTTRLIANPEKNLAGFLGEKICSGDCSDSPTAKQMVRKGLNIAMTIGESVAKVQYCKDLSNLDSQLMQQPSCESNPSTLLVHERKLYDTKDTKDELLTHYDSHLKNCSNATTSDHSYDGCRFLSKSDFDYCIELMQGDVANSTTSESEITNYVKSLTQTLLSISARAPVVGETVTPEDRRKELDKVSKNYIDRTIGVNELFLLDLSSYDTQSKTTVPNSISVNNKTYEVPLSCRLNFNILENQCSLALAKDLYDYLENGQQKLVDPKIQIEPTDSNIDAVAASGNNPKQDAVNPTCMSNVNYSDLVSNGGSRDTSKGNGQDPEVLKNSLKIFLEYKGKVKPSESTTGFTFNNDSSGSPNYWCYKKALANIISLNSDYKNSVRNKVLSDKKNSCDNNANKNQVANLISELCKKTYPGDKKCDKIDGVTTPPPAGASNQEGPTNGKVDDKKKTPDTEIEETDDERLAREKAEQEERDRLAREERSRDNNGGGNNSDDLAMRALQASEAALSASRGTQEMMLRLSDKFDAQFVGKGRGFTPCILCKIYAGGGGVNPTDFGSMAILDDYTLSNGSALKTPNLGSFWGDG